jgi:phosphoribosylformylglycinamidine synthase
VGHATAQRQLRVSDSRLGGHPVDLPMDLIFGKTPKMQRDTTRRASGLAAPLRLPAAGIGDDLLRVLRHPSVGSKAWLISIGDRTVGGLCARDPMVGPWQLPVADCAVTLLDFEGYAGEAMALGERTPLALIDPAAAARMAVGEALTNLAAAPVDSLAEVKLSANWMAAVPHPGEDAALYDAVRAIGLELCPALGVSIPVGKDSLSMQARWHAGGREYQVVAPVSPVVTAFARVGDVRRALTPLLRFDEGPSELLLVDLGGGRNRLGGSALAHTHGQLGDSAPDADDAAGLKAFFEAIQVLNLRGLVLAYHDRSDGGAIVALLEMAFAGHCGLDLLLDGWARDTRAALFAEELGALLQVRDSDVPLVREILAAHGLGPLVHGVGRPLEGETVRLRQDGRVLGSFSRSELVAAWHETSHAMQRLRDDPACADEERAALCAADDPGLVPRLGFDPGADIAAPYIATGARPRVAILREQGVNGQVEMAAAFTRAGFDAVDVHMSDLIEGRARLMDFTGLVACGGFSYGDVLGAGRGWATSIRYHGALAEQFEHYFADRGRFALGVCNGCQALAALKDLIPGAQAWPRFLRNRSEQFEARLALVEVLPSPSLFLRGMQGSRIPVAVAHGEGRAAFDSPTERAAALACVRYVDARGAAAQRYPANPNGSTDAITGLTNADGRITVLMPHPERVFRSVQMSWRPAPWGEDSPWMRMFRNARAWVG